MTSRTVTCETSSPPSTANHRDIPRPTQEAKSVGRGECIPDLARTGGAGGVCNPHVVGPHSKNRQYHVRPPRWRLAGDARYPSPRLGEPSARWAHGKARMRPGCDTGPATAAAMAPGSAKKTALHPPAPYDARPRRNDAAMTASPLKGSRLAHLLSTTYATSNRPPLLSGRGARDPWRWRWRGPDRTNFCDLRPIFAPYERKSAS